MRRLLCWVFGHKCNNGKMNGLVQIVRADNRVGFCTRCYETVPLKK